MVKKAEKERKRNPLQPIFALLLIVGLLAIAYVLTTSVLFNAKIAIGRTVISTLGVPSNNPPLTFVAAFTFAIWIALLAVSYFLVAVLVGKDPNDADDMPLPPKNKKEKTYKRR